MAEPVADRKVFCSICERNSPLGECETATVRSNLRYFRDEVFGVWRCPSCRCIHATEEVDLDYYYSKYVSFPPEVEARMHSAYGGFQRRLEAAGIDKTHRVLDYGCGSGALVRFLRAQGYDQTFGYDAYIEDFQDRSTLEQPYDCVISQDVIEHVQSPLAWLRDIDKLVKPRGFAVIGTPDANAIDLSTPEEFVHTLHAPYHRHILTKDALEKAASDVGWGVKRFYSTMYGNTLIPGANPRFGAEYMRCHDDCLDLLMEPVRLNSWRFLAPKTILFFFFGYFFDRHTDVMFVFHKGEA